MSAGPFGVTAAGFVPKPLEQITLELETDTQSAYGAGVDLIPQSNFGQWIGIISDRLLDLWNLGLAVFTAGTAEGSTGVAEDAVNSLTGCIRDPAVTSTVLLTLTGTNASDVTSGSIAAVDSLNGNQFVTQADAVLATATSWAGTTSYNTGDYRTNVGNIYYATAGGISAGSGGPTGTGSSIPDGSGSLVWTFVGTGAAMALVVADGITTGPLAGPAGTITTIVTPISGWESVWNSLDAVLGANVETDSVYRLRRDATLGNEGKAYLNAIRAAVLAVGEGTTNPVTSCKVFENDTDAVVDGMPGHSIEALVQGGDDFEVATAIFLTVAAGIQPFGQSNTVTETVTDSAGEPHTVQFSRPTAVPVYISLGATVNPGSINFNPTDGGAATVQAQLVQWLNNLGAGFDVTASFASAQAFIANVGAWLVTSAFVGVAPSPAGSSVSITARQIATTTAGNVVVTITQAAP